MNLLSCHVFENHNHQWHASMQGQGFLHLVAEKKNDGYTEVCCIAENTPQTRMQDNHISCSSWEHHNQALHQPVEVQ